MVLVALMFSSALFMALPVSGAAGNLIAPVYADGDWWNYTVSGSYYLPSNAEEYEVDFDNAQGWLRYEVDGTTSYLGEVAWIMKVTGNLYLTGGWTGNSETGDTNMAAEVTGKEWRSVKDLAILGSSTLYTGALEIATMTGPLDYNMIIGENMTMDAPLRMMLFPVPIAQFPSEEHTVTITRVFTTGTMQETMVEVWDYAATYRGLSDVQGAITYSDQNKFDVKGNVTVDSKPTAFEGSIYYEGQPRKAVTVDGVRNMEVVNYHITQAIIQPDLVVGEAGFNSTHYYPIEGKEINITGIVHNLGARDVMDVSVELWASLEGELASRQNHTRIHSIASNDKAIVHFNWTAEVIGEWEFTLRVDPANTVTEAREDNNDVSMLVYVIPFAPRPNLVVEDDGITLDPPSPVHNRTAVRITASIANLGDGDAGNVTVDFYMGPPGAGGKPIAWRETIDIIPSGESRTAWINWAADEPGSHEIWLYIDQENAINETVETDNLGHIPIIIIASPEGGVDLTVAYIKVLDPNRDESTPLPSGMRTTVQVIVTNQGPHDATRVHLSVYVDSENVEGLIGSKEGHVNTNEPQTWDLEWVVDREDGDHEMIATVYAIGDVETTFNDNTKVHTFTIGPRVLPQPEPLSVTIFPDANLLTPGQKVQVSGKVTFEKNGFEVPGATVSVWFNGENQPDIVTTNELGRYLAELTVPTNPGSYRLIVSANLGNSEGENTFTVTVKPEDGNTGGTGGENDGINMVYFGIALVIILAIGMPLTYYFLMSKSVIDKRIRKVHEEILEIVDEEK
jgi:hypothetical protein